MQVATANIYYFLFVNNKFMTWNWRSLTCMLCFDQTIIEQKTIFVLCCTQTLLWDVSWIQDRLLNNIIRYPVLFIVQLLNFRISLMHNGTAIISLRTFKFSYKFCQFRSQLEKFNIGVVEILQKLSHWIYHQSQKKKFKNRRWQYKICCFIDEWMTAWITLFLLLK